MNQDKIAIKENVQMENDLRDIAAKYIPQIKNILRQHVGQKIQKVDNRLLVKIVLEIEPILEAGRALKLKPLRAGGFAKIHFMYIETSAYSLWLKIGTNYNGGKLENKTHYGQYRDSSYYLGEVKNSVLTSVYEDQDYTQIDADQEQKNFDRAAELKKEYEQTAGELLPINKELLKYA